MSTISVRIPDHLHERVRRLAETENVSINQLINLALTEKVSALLTEDYLRARAGRGDRAAFEAALAKVPAAEPEERDRL